MEKIQHLHKLLWIKELFLPGLGGGACEEKPPCERTDSQVLSCVRGRGFQCKFPGVAGKKMTSSITPSDRTAYTHKSTHTFHV